MTKGKRISDLLKGQPIEESQDITRRAKELEYELDYGWRRHVQKEMKPEKKHPIRYKVEEIINYQLLEHTFNNYLSKDYREVFWCMRQYGDFEFFRDLAIYLNYRYHNEVLKQKTYEFFIDLYYG